MTSRMFLLAFEPGSMWRRRRDKRSRGDSLPIGGGRDAGVPFSGGAAENLEAGSDVRHQFSACQLAAPR